MSLNEEKSNEDNYRRDSFEDRVCDDLCEVILQYLSLEDWLRLECVSKQFQRTAFLSKIEDYLRIPLKIVSDLNPYIKLFKKYPKINKIQLSSPHVNFDQQITINRDLFEVFINYCNNLTHVWFVSIGSLENEDKKKFFDKFGHKLSSIINYCPNIDIRKATNIEELIVDSFDPQLSQIQFNKLRVLKPELLDSTHFWLKTWIHLKYSLKTIEKHSNIWTSLSVLMRSPSKIY